MNLHPSIHLVLVVAISLFGTCLRRAVAFTPSSLLLASPRNARVASNTLGTNTNVLPDLVNDMENASDAAVDNTKTKEDGFYLSEKDSITWHSKSFADLSAGELYELLRLRAEVFVVEQDCAYQDCDDKDQDAIHFYGTLLLDDDDDDDDDDDGETTKTVVVAYARILAAGVSYDTPSIGRVLTSSIIRGKGKGHELMTRAIRCCEDNFGKGTMITISAQEHLEKYYEKLGFRRGSESYLEDGIPHVKMEREDD